MNNEIHIVCATDSNYIPYCGVMMTSLFENNKEERICMHILGMELTDDNIKELSHIGKKYTQSILFYNVGTLITRNDSLKKWNNQNKKHLSLATFSRLFIEELLPSTINQVLYLDVDIIVCGSLHNLWTDGLGEHIVGWVTDGTPEPNARRLHLLKYFNAGVLLLNLDLWRKNNITQQCLEYWDIHWRELLYEDQDVLNHILQKYNCKALHPKYNVIPCFFQCDFYFKKFIPQIYWLTGREAIRKPVIIHYISSIKPWHKDCDHPMRSEWLKFLQMTRWKDMKISYKRTSYERVKLSVKEFLKDISRLIPSIKKAHPHPRWYILHE